MVGVGIGGGNAVFVGGAWYAVNGWLTWALGESPALAPGAGAYALDELERNTLAAHAAAFPGRCATACSPWTDGVHGPAHCGIDLLHTNAGHSCGH